jgi:hypothetical protein
VSLDIFNIVQFGSEGVRDIDNDDFPVGFTLVEKGHDSQNLDLLDLPSIPNLFTDLANIERIVVALCLCLRVGLRGILPSLL